MKRLFTVGGIVLALVLAASLSQAQVMIQVRGRIVEFDPNQPDMAIEKMPPVIGAKIKLESLEDGSSLPPRSPTRRASSFSS